MEVRLNLKFNGVPVAYNYNTKLYFALYENARVNITHKVIDKFSNIIPNVHLTN